MELSDTLEDSNDAELNPKYMGTITADFLKTCDALKEASYQVRSRKFSQYPVFPICKDRLEWGQMLYDKDELGLQWSYYISMLEEFVQRGIVADEEQFKSVYKDADEFCCLFVVDKLFVNFVFVPYPNDDNSVELD